MAEPAAPPPPAAHASRKRLIAARILTVLGILLVVVTILANFVKREALDSERFRSTSEALVTDEAIRTQVAATLVEQLYANIDVNAALAAKLPPNLKGLAGPIAGASREAADRAAQELLQRPRAQEAFVNAAALAQRQLVAVLDGDTPRLQTTGGKVVLDVRPLVLALGDRFSFLPDLESKVPPGAAQVTILESDQLKTAQNATKALRFVAAWIWVLALGSWAAAVWLARGRRRIEVRAIAIGIVAAGFLILLVRTLAGRYLVDHLVKTDAVKPAVSNAYGILTELLRGAGWTAVLLGVVGLIGVWLTGEGERPTEARHWLAPYLRRWEIAYGVLVAGYLLLLWWRPTPQFGYWINILIFFGLAVAGLEALRRQAVAEFPDAEPGVATAAVKGAVVSRKRSSTTIPTEELEKLARLHRDGVLDDVEFAKAKAQLLGS